jgi:hypothetical protein
MATKKTMPRVGNGNGRVDDEHKEAEIQAEFERLQRKGWDKMTLREKTFVTFRLAYLDANGKTA